MLLFCDSFDHYTTILDKWDSQVTAGAGNPMVACTINSAAARTGSAGLRSTTGGSFQGTSESYIQKATNSTADTLIVGMGLQPKYLSSTDPNGNDTPYNRGGLIHFSDGGLEQCSIKVINGGQVRATRGSTTLGTSANALSLDVYRFVEIKVKIHNTTGTVDILVDGVTWLSLTGLNTRGGTSNNYASNLIIFHRNWNAVNDSAITPNRFYIDDFYLIDNTGSYNTTYLGDVAIKAVLPTGNGGVTNFTRGGADSGNNYGQVDENPPNGDTDYNYSGTVSDKDRYTYPSITGTTIPAVVVTPFARKDDGGTRSIRAIANLSGTEVDSGTDIPMSTGYHFYQGIFERDPNGSAWTQSNVNSTEFGVKVTA